MVSIWGASPSDVWAVGGRGTVHWDGAAWSPVTEPPLGTVTPTDVAGRATDDVWVVDWNGRILHRSR